jgi:hypothetical protein
MPALRRLRGLLLRLVRRRRSSIAIGAALAAPAAWIQWQGAGSWWIEGASLVALATGVALIWTGISGPRGDWIQS